MYHYYPSCTFNNLDPVSAKDLREYAKMKGMAVRACCHFDKTELTEEDMAVYFCQACRETIEKNESRNISFWEILDQDPSFVFPDYHGMEFVLQDCYRDRNHPEIHKAVRSLLTKMNIRYVELPRNKENSDFCGTLHFETVKYADDIPSFDHISHNGKEMTKKLMEEKVEQLQGLPVICYCGRCLNGILLGEGHPVHLMTLINNHYLGREEQLEAHALDLLSKPDPRYKMMKEKRSQ